MKNNIIVMIVVLVVTIQSCRQKTEGVQIDSFSDSIWGISKSGSYWIYEDSNGKRDTSLVTEYSRGYVQNVNPQREFLTLFISSKVPDNSIQVSVECLSIERTTSNFLHNYPYGERLSISSSYGKIDTMLSSSRVDFVGEYQVNQYFFKDAMKIYTVDDRYIIVAPSVGIIEKRLDNNPPMKIIFYSLIK